jgi:hypothetical protein
MKATALNACDIIAEISKGANFSNLALGGAVNLMSQFGISSTGTAISSLSGAAARNALLAAFGGGSLAAGGGGMVLGSAVLGGITILPSITIMAWNYAKNSEKYLTEAKEIHAKITKENKNIQNAIDLLKNEIDKRIEEVKFCINGIINIYRSKVFPDLKESYEHNKNFNGEVDFKKCSNVDKEKIKRAAYFLKKLKEIIAVKILDNANNPTQESEYILNDILKDKKIWGY